MAPTRGAIALASARGLGVPGGRGAGFTLVETLAAMLVLAVALLGLARLQLAMHGAAGDSLAVLAAGAHVASHLERLRALHDAPAEARLHLAGRGTPFECSAARACSAAEFAAAEAWAWHGTLGPRLPGASAPPPRFDAPDARGRTELHIELRDRTLLALEITT
ncbi:MAG: prepilin-type N-terminal cleavage/methylation domain-containing protein [Pseudomonadota bacterium]